MHTAAKIALGIPERPTGYFNLRLKQKLVNEPAVFRRPREVVVISCSQGSFWGLSKLLRMTGVTDKAFKWKLNDGHLVILGDSFDQCEQLVQSLWLIYSLEDRARRAGGYVHFILGDCEICNMNANWRYEHPKYAASGNSIRTPPAALYHGNNELWKWLKTKNVVERIGDLLFVCRGISPLLGNFVSSVKQINDIARPQYKEKAPDIHTPAPSFSIDGVDSPTRYGGYFDGTASEKQVDELMDRLGVTTIVTGSAQASDKLLYFSGKVINIAQGCGLPALMIKKDRFCRIDDDGKKEVVK